MYIVEYDGFDFDSYYRGSNNYRGTIRKYFDSAVEAYTFANSPGQDDYGIGDGKNWRLKEDKKNVRVYQIL